MRDTYTSVRTISWVLSGAEDTPVACGKITETVDEELPGSTDELVS